MIQGIHFLNLIIVIIKFMQLFKPCETGVAEKKLLAYLFDVNRLDAHNPRERPVAEEKNVLMLNLEFSLNQIIDVDEKNQILAVRGWIDMTWDDYHFKWNPEDYNNITEIVLPFGDVWTPDLLLYNSADERINGMYATNVVANYSGRMNWIPPVFYRSSCEISIHLFPFDTQTCPLKLGVWTYHGSMIDLGFKHPLCSDHDGCPADNSSYSHNGEWHVKSMIGRKHKVGYSCCTRTYVDITYNVTLERKTLYYTFNLIVPCALISTMALLVFALPPDAGEKISLGVTIMLSLTMFLLLVADKMPQTSGAIPLIGMYFSSIMVMCSLSLISTVVVLNYHHRSNDTTEVPLFVHKFINTWLANLLWMKRRDVDHSKWETGNETPLLKSNGCSMFPIPKKASLDEEFKILPSSKSYNNIAGNISWHYEELQFIDDQVKVYVHSKSNDKKKVNISPKTIQNLFGKQRRNSSIRYQISQDLLEIKRALFFITNEIRQKEISARRSSEWRFAARVVDRFCLILFSIVTFISSSSILLIPKKVTNSDEHPLHNLTGIV